MSDSPYRTTRVLAIDPFHRGIAFAVFEGPESLAGFGLKYAPGHDAPKRMLRLSELLAFYQPDLLIIEDYHVRGARHRTTARRFVEQAAMFATHQGVRVETISRDNVLSVFGRRASKFDIGLALTSRFPELRDRLPKKRKIWEAERERTNFFDAVALAWAFLHPRDAAK
jgi:hypothetical protein